MKLIILNGASCSGKSTLLKSVLAKQDRCFKLSYDSIKRSFSNYNRVEHYRDIQELIRVLAASVMEMEYDILCDSALYADGRGLLIDIAKAHSYEVIEINLEAEYEVLARRFDLRVANSVDALIKPTNLSKERFKELYDIYQKEKNPEAITFRTDLSSTEDIELEVDHIINSKHID